MASETSDISALAPTSSTIVPSPSTNVTAVDVDKDALLENGELKSATVPNITSHGSQTKSEIYQLQSSSGEFGTPAGDCIIPVQPNPQNTQENEVAVATMESQEPVEDDLRSLQAWPFRFRTICYLYHIVSNFVAESKYMIPLHFLFLAMPISSGFMAARYMDQCPLSSATPFLMFMMGITGTIVLLCRMLITIRKNMLPSQPDWWLLRTISLFGILIIILFLSTEMWTFFRISPSFEIGTTNYCNEIFYNFTYWMNWAASVVLVVLLFLHAPSCSFDSLRRDEEFGS